jgi:hypothetical protein
MNGALFFGVTGLPKNRWVLCIGLVLVGLLHTNTGVRTMAGSQWSRLLASIESQRSQFNDLRLKTTEMVKKLLPCPVSTPAVGFSTLPVQFSLPRINSVSVPTPDLSLLGADLLSIERHGRGR